jgi:hypothetical protein
MSINSFRNEKELTESFYNMYKGEQEQRTFVQNREKIRTKPNQTLKSFFPY